MTLAELSHTLAKMGVPDPSTEARLLLSHLFDLSFAALLAEPMRSYESDALFDALARRKKREPLQHILGEVFFYGERYTVSADCLIPRADTELLVEEAIRRLPKGAVFADLCTGSGCIALSVLAHRPDLSAVAADLSDAALAVAKKNAAALGLSDRIRFFKCDLLSDPLPFDLPEHLLSNPPYISRSVLPTLAPELAYEPQMALDGGEDGLLFYRSFLSRFSPRLFLLEIGYDQGAALLSLAQSANYRAQILRDAGGCDRVAVLENAKK